MTRKMSRSKGTESYQEKHEPKEAQKKESESSIWMTRAMQDEAEAASAKISFDVEKLSMV